MITRGAIFIGLVCYATAFSGSPIIHKARSRVVLRAGHSMKIGVFYGSTTGKTESVATRLATALGAVAVDIGSIDPAQLATYDTLIVGAPTWHTGEDQERSGTEWDSVIYSDLPKMDLTGKKVAFFGCGDSQSYNDYFCDAVGELYDQFSATGASCIGAMPYAEGLDTMDSKARRDGKYVGLCCDEDNYNEETDKAIAMWVDQLQTEGAA